MLDSGEALRFHDPRRFGSLHLDPQGSPASIRSSRSSAPSPSARRSTREYLYRATRKRAVAIKQLIMNSQIVVGVGNIYASEALFRARIAPRRAARRITRAEAHALVRSIKEVLEEAIEIGGTTLRDYVNAEGTPGYFRAEALRLRAGERAVPRVQVADQAIHTGAALDVLVRRVPAVRRRRFSRTTPPARRNLMRRRLIVRQVELEGDSQLTEDPTDLRRQREALQRRREGDQHTHLTALRADALE